jgi:hypothetical protein
LASEEERRGKYDRDTTSYLRLVCSRGGYRDALCIVWTDRSARAARCSGAEHSGAYRRQSAEMRNIIALPLRPGWNVLPKTGDEWKAAADAGAAATAKLLPGMRERLHVKVESTTIDGVRAFIVTPDVIPPENRNRLLVHVHGGC